MQHSNTGHNEAGSRKICLFGVLFWLSLPAVASAQESAPSLTELDIQYQQSLDAGLYGEAADTQKRYIGTLLSDPRYDRVEWGRVLDRLADAQLLDDDHRSASENFELAVEVLENETNRLDGVLIEPLIGLARAQTGTGAYGEAIRTYKRAIHVQQVNNGPHAFGQAIVLDEMSKVAFDMGDYDSANRYKLAYASVYRQNYDDDYLKQVDALLSQARMFASTGKLLDAQYSYRRIIADIEDADGGKSLALLPAIYQFVDLLQNHTIADGINGSDKARRFLRRAVYIAERHPEATAMHRAEAYLAYADHLSVNSADDVSALRYYRQAWAELSSDATLLEVRNEHFAKPVLLNPIPYNSSPVMRKVLRLSTSSNDEISLTRLAASFDIDTRGSARNISIVEGDPTGYMDPILLRHVEMFVFRPRFVDSEPVAYIDQIYVIEYPDTDMAPELGQNSLGIQSD